MLAKGAEGATELRLADTKNARIGLICASPRRAPTRGHISLALPRYAAANGQDALLRDGVVIAPLQSQAGARNDRRFATTWWRSRLFDRVIFAWTALVRD